MAGSGSGLGGGAVNVDELTDEDLQAAVDDAKAQVRRMLLETQMFQGEEKILRMQTETFENSGN